MKFVSPFEPLSFWAQGPWVFFNMGLKFMQTWQDECFSRLSLVVPPAGKSLARNGVKPEQTLCEIQLLKKEIAATQGRQMPLLGCLQDVQVVGGPTAEVTPKVAAKPAGVKAPAPAPAPAAAAAVEAVESTESIGAASSAPSVTSMLAMQAKSLAKAVKVAPVVDQKTAAKKAAKPAAKAVAKPAAPASVKAAAKPAAVAAPAQKAVKPAASAKPAAKTKPVASKKA